MTPGYDAKAIAEVMGLEFQRYPATAPSNQVNDAFVFTMDGDMVRIVATTDERIWVGPSYDAPDFRFPHLLPSSFMMERAVALGLPSIAHRNVLWVIDGWPPMEHDAGAQPATNRLSPTDSERTERIARLFVHARRALGSEAEARQFMTTPHPQLDNRAPMELAQTDLGTRHAEHILNTLEFGLAV